jgi:hypothetical protein
MIRLKKSSTISQTKKWICAGVLLGYAAMPNTGFAEGVIDGGGGGTLPIDPVSVGTIEGIALHSKKHLRLYSRFLRVNYLKNSAAASGWEQKLSGGSRTLVDVVEDTGIEVRNNDNCYDAAGNAVDASIFASHPGSICLSAFRIAPKLDADGASHQTLALIVHEFAHLLGTSEVEAVDAQKVASRRLKSESYPIDVFTDQANYWSNASAREISRLITALDSGERLSSDAYERLVDAAGSAIRHCNFYDESQAISIYPTNLHQDYMSLVQIRMRLIDLFLTTQRRYHPDEASEAQRKIDRVFGLNTSIPFSQIANLPGNAFASSLVVKVADRQGVRDQLVVMKSYFESQLPYLKRIHSDHDEHGTIIDGPLPAYPDPQP